MPQEGWNQSAQRRACLFFPPPPHPPPPPFSCHKDDEEDDERDEHQEGFHHEGPVGGEAGVYACVWIYDVCLCVDKKLVVGGYRSGYVCVCGCMLRFGGRGLQDSIGRV